MEYRFSGRMASVPKSFLEELFRVSSDPSIISFAGGLPATELIDAEGLVQATREVIGTAPSSALQYTTTDGYLPLREYIAERYRRRFGISADPSEIQIVNGSQQCLDLVAKIFVDPGDCIGMERPGYLGAIEAFSFYEPVIRTVPSSDRGLDLTEFEALIREKKPRFFYGIPNSQNPSGRSYPLENRKAIAGILEGSDTLIFEDDAFGELFFDAKPRIPVKKFIPDQGLLSGSFSKIIAPGMRIGWIWAPEKIIRAFNTAKQAADLHSNFLCQKILHQYLTTHDLDAHIATIASAYKRKCDLMCRLLDEECPDLAHTRPEGGMFMTAALPQGLDAMEVFREGVARKVAVLPGMPFFAQGGGRDLIRLNFSYPSEEQIAEGIGRLATVIESLRNKKRLHK